MSNENPRPFVPFEDGAPLSEVGLSRRDAMLPLLERAMGRRVRRRRVVRMGASAAVFLVVGLVIFRNWPAKPVAPGSPLPVAAVDPAPPVSNTLAMRYASFTVVQAATAPSAIVELDDEALLHELRAIGHPTGMIRTRGEVILTADVGIKAGEPIPGGS